MSSPVAAVILVSARPKGYHHGAGFSPIATLLGRWFWWPQVVYPRGDYHFVAPQRRRSTDDSDTVALPAQA
jgi:hypothetical protein